MIIGTKVILEDAVRWTVNGSFVEYTDLMGTRVALPITLIARLYEGAKADYERRFPDVSWDDFLEQEFRYHELQNLENTG